MWKDIVMKDNLVFWVKKILFVLLKIFYICPVKKNGLSFLAITEDNIPVIPNI